MAFSRIRPRSATLSDWTAVNPVLRLQELGIVHPNTGTGTGKVKFKIGDGITAFNSLPYAYDEDLLGIGNLSNLINSASDLVTALNNDTTINSETNGNGVLYNSGLVVSAQSTPNMTVLVSTGTVYMPNGKRYTPTANTALTVNAANSTNPRIDIVYINSSGVISYLAGTATSSPTAPTLPNGCILLSEISVTANATTITSSNITDKRTIIKSNTGLASEINQVNNNVGDKSLLPTTNKTNIVISIIEIDTKKINNANIANNLVTTTTGLVLDATQGKILKDEINAIPRFSVLSGAQTIPAGTVATYTFQLFYNHVIETIGQIVGVETSNDVRINRRYGAAGVFDVYSAVTQIVYVNCFVIYTN